MFAYKLSYCLSAFDQRRRISVCVLHDLVGAYDVNVQGNILYSALVIVKNQ